MSPNSKNNRIVRTNYLAKGQAFNTSLFKADTVEIDSTLNEGDVLIRTLYLAHDPCKLLLNFARFFTEASCALSFTTN